MHLKSSARLLSLCLAILACSVRAVHSGDWLQFRGDNFAGVADGPVPTAWDIKTGEHVAWKAALPGKGPASPIIVGERIIVTAASGVKQDRLHVLCFNTADGAKLWERQFWATGRTLCHPTSGVAAPTPTSDGKLIYAFYSSNDLVCLDLDGNLQWFRGLALDLPGIGNDTGMASSPVVAGDAVVVQIESQAESFAVGIDKRTGETRWTDERERAANWASPIALRGKSPSDDVVLLQSPGGLSAHNPQSGEELWKSAASCAGVASSAVDGDIIYVPGEGIRAIKHRAGSANPQVLWTENRLSPGSASPVLHAGKIYAVNRAGVVTCANAKTGEIAWQTRVKGPFWATPIIAGQHMYCVNQEGDVQIIKLPAADAPADEKGELVATLPTGESILATPAAANGALYLRSNGHLWKISK